MSQTSRKSVVIIGGGFSGAMLAVQLLRGDPTLPVAVIDPRELPARGLAYSTEYGCHLLNVPAADMSALPDQPAHFWNWLHSHTGAPVDRWSFQPRQVYGKYVAELLEETAAGCGGNFDWMNDEAVSVESGAEGLIVRRKSGEALAASSVVLALGNFPPGNLGIPGLTDGARRYKRHAWSKAALADLTDDDEILLVGSGLTSVDVAVALRSKNFKGKIHVLSRHGLLPQRHQKTARWPRFWDANSPRSVRGLLREIREQIAQAEDAGSNWRAVMDSIRPLVQEIWKSLPHDERRRFLRHARAYWEVHRHRIAPEIADTFDSMINTGQLQTHAGRILSYNEQPDAAEVTFRLRGSITPQTQRVARMINCSGPETNYRKIESPLLAGLFARGLVQQDSLGLGLDVDENGALVDNAGQPSPRLFALGPARKARCWETTAVPELRCQAAELAEHLLQNVLHRDPVAREVETVSTL